MKVQIPPQRARMALYSIANQGYYAENYLITNTDIDQMMFAFDPAEGAGFLCGPVCRKSVRGI